MTTKKNLPKVAYFCMEYALESDIKTYAGGLGILAGDYMKAAKDHAFPIVGIGIKWKQGYGTQEIDHNGKPYDAYHNYQYADMEDTGKVVFVHIRGTEVGCKIWKVKRSDVHELYLLDTDFPNNPDSWITGQLYGWFGEERIAQEMVLGIGGVRALRALGYHTDVYHFNEGHAFFAGLELIREKTTKGVSFEQAWQQTRKEVVFTTHTPIVQGNESHPIERLMYMGANLGLTIDQLCQIGGSPFIDITRMRNKQDATMKFLVEQDTSLIDFYETYQPWLESDSVIKKIVNRYEDTLSNTEKKKILEGQYVYELSFSNKGGTVMPIIIEWLYKDSTKETMRIPVEIWRKNEKFVKKTFVLSKPVLSIVIDPMKETADINESNNTWPYYYSENEFEIFKAKMASRNKKSTELNPMQKHNQQKSK